MHEEIAKWKGDKQVRKTDVDCRKATWNPRPKTTVTLRCRAENVQLGKGYACGTAVARRRMATKGKFDGRHAWGWRITARRQGESVSNYPTRFNNINNKLMHPQFNAESPDQAQWPKIQINPIDGRSSEPRIPCTTWPHQINQKKVTTPERHVLEPEPCHVAMPEAGQSRSKLKKEVSTADKRKWSPVLRPVFQPATNDRVKSERRRCPVLRGQLFNTSNSTVWEEKNGRLFHFT